MGSVDFSTLVKTDESVQTAYKRAVDDAAFRYGHDPYNGTIATTNGVVVVAQARSWEKAVELETFYWENEDLPDGQLSARGIRAEKWGTALAIEVLGPKHGWLFFGWAAS